MQTIIFDLGGTLLEYAGDYKTWPELETPGFEAAYASFEADGLDLLPFKAFLRVGFDLMPARWLGAVTGERNLEIADLLGETAVTASLHNPPTIPTKEMQARAGHAYEQAISQQAELIEHVQETIHWIKAQGFKLGLISNTMFRGEMHINDLQHYGIANHFDAMLFSCEVNLWKPNPDLFQLMLDKLGVSDPTTAVYIGDDPNSDIPGAKALGMKTVHFPSNQRFPNPNGYQPTATITSLSELPALLQSWLTGNVPTHPSA